MQSDEASPDPRIDALRQLGASLRVTKSGKILAVDFRTSTRPATDADVRLLQGQSRLKDVNLESAAITNASIDDLSNLPALLTLDLQRTAISDEGLSTLGETKQLRLLLLRGSQVTQATVAAMRKRMLKTRIVFD